MTDGLPLAPESGQPRRCAERLLEEIARTLGVDPAFFFRGSSARAAPPPPARAAELEELLRLFRSIDDPDLRRSALDLIRTLREEAGRAR